MSRRKRIGIFGGTFDPIHSGHLRSARIVQKRFRLDRIFFVPAAVPPHKARPDLSPAKDRLRMTALAVGRHPGWTVSPMEIRSEGPSYSIRTVEKMQRRYPRARLFFIVGADAFEEIRTWHDWERVLRSCLFIVTTRPGSSLSAAARALGSERRGALRRVRPGEPVREEWFDRNRVFLLPIEALSVSSTEIRRRAGEGRSLAGLVPPAVAAYIRSKGLYAGNPGGSIVPRRRFEANR